VSGILFPSKGLLTIAYALGVATAASAAADILQTMFRKRSPDDDTAAKRSFASLITEPGIYGGEDYPFYMQYLVNSASEIGAIKTDEIEDWMEVLIPGENFLTSFEAVLEA
jgi:hypothetical protein